MDKDEVKNIILNSFYEKKNSHAFLLVTNNINECLKDVTDIIRKINCKNKGTDTCECNICRTILGGTNPDFLIVKPDGKEIKKDQILNIINTFLTKPLISTYSTYVICEADKMNDSSANKILKFLEEPESNIIGFFITDKINSIIPTIKSRCEIYNYHFGSNNILDLLEINEEEYDKLYNNAIDLVIKLNNEPKYILMSEAKNLAKFERDELDKLFNLLKRFYVVKYENILNYKYLNVDYVNLILNSIDTNNISLIVKRLKILDNMINDLKFNVNKELFINKFFLIWE